MVEINKKKSKNDRKISRNSNSTYFKLNFSEIEKILVDCRGNEYFVKKTTVRN